MRDHCASTDHGAVADGDPRQYGRGSPDPNIIADADLIITGEGRIDGQSAGGKVLDGIGRYAKKRNIPVIALTGGMGDNAHLVYDCGIDSIMVTVNAPMSLDTALTHAEPLLADCADRLFRFIKIGMNLR